MANKFDKTMVPEDFTLSLVLVDAIPVIFFGASTLVISMLLHSGLFMFGALLCLFAGICKVIWKLIVVLQKKNIWGLFIQMRILMPIGFLLILLSLFLKRAEISAASLMAGFTSMPSMIFFIIGIAGMCLMIVFSRVLDSGDLRSNWIEQLTNGLAQISIFLGFWLLL